MDRSHVEYMDRRFAEAMVVSKPYPHIYIRDVLPPMVYRAMCEALPREDYVFSCPPNAPSDASRFIGLRSDSESTVGMTGTVSLPWHNTFLPYIDYVDSLVDQAFAPAIARYYDSLIATGQMKHAPAHLSPGQALFCFRPAGWQIEPHVHSLGQLIQTMIYFPSPGFLPDQGTYLYYHPWFQKRPSLKELIDATVPFKPSWRKKLAPFEHNTLLSFLNTPDSIHGTVDRSGDPVRRYTFTARTIDSSVFIP
jgi:hypothetical protein